MSNFPDRLSSGYRSFLGGRFAAERARYQGLAQTGQSPSIMVIGCVDSRVSPEVIFDAHPGEIFVVRNVANLVPPYHPDGDLHGTSAALEFAVMGLRIEHIVVMGHKSVYVPYVDPGLVLSRAVRDAVSDFIDAEGVLPKCIMLENHGLFAMADTPKKILNIHDMAEKMSRILLGCYATGGPRWMSEADIRRIDSRPDEHYRQRNIAQAAKG